MSAMADYVERALESPMAVAIGTSAVAFASGMLLGAYSVRGYLFSPEFQEERRRNRTDPMESEESDIDDDTILDHAPNWANGMEADVRDGLRSRKKKGSSAEKSKGQAESDEECKLVLVVRSDLGMTKAQCGHATLACYKTLQRQAANDPKSPAARLLQRWERHGQAKIALQDKGEDALLALMGTAHSLGITSEVIVDAGRTQIESGSMTVLGVGPAPKSLVDKVTGHLKLL
ncbi:mitochondrial peptidyl-tRNA hydrolase [Grosmannia clavigera kw1407]|uniref:peptidyl-tRNA hydrolase n=1 Tax=Grosmannia clavigera (strain kw1407 / UAMH 11150) TaxID=655863 RepID=F0X807_GROCL|nr:mitochondrial peptidyl-tRNA hydrolase [Grosmannia clavigera kw1407]EFX06235.1 mitochondrial peptidyl-tRNA hydrolase [Grosmannia clavigera kw1407]